MLGVLSKKLETLRLEPHPASKKLGWSCPELQALTSKLATLHLNHGALIQEPDLPIWELRNGALRLDLCSFVEKSLAKC